MTPHVSEQRPDSSWLESATVHPRADSTAVPATLAQLRRLMTNLNAGLDLRETMHAVVEGVVSGVDFGVAVISMTQPEGDLAVTAVAGDEDARQVLSGSRSPRAEWDRMLALATPVGPTGSLRLLRHTGGSEWDDATLPSWVPSEVRTSPDGDREPWHPMDALFAPLSSPTAGLLGMLSVDLPPDGLQPTPEHLALLELFVAQAATALEHARLHTELLAANEAARTALAARLQAVIDASPAAIVEVDRTGTVVQWSRSAERLLGHSADVMLGHDFPQQGDRAVDLPGAFAWLDSGHEIPVVDLTWTRADGSVVDLEVSAGPTYGPDGAVHGMMALLGDVTERKQLERQLQWQATHDQLTGLPNRRLLTERLETALADPGRCTAVLAIDIDRFRDINDTLGHDLGDQLLMAVAERLAAQLGEDDVLARVGGDEFVVVSPDAVEDDAVTLTCADILRALHRTFHLLGVPVDIEASIGFATGTGPHRTAEQLLREADLAMHEAKRTSSGIAGADPERTSRPSDRVALLGELRRAMDRRELTVHYQPQVDVATGHLYGLEALVRWQHPDRGLLAPGTFLHVAENSGLIRPLTLQVLDLVCRQAARWRELQIRLPVAVNLSSRNLHDRRLATEIAHALDRYQLPSSALRLEVTESAVMNDPRRALAVLRDLSRAGLDLSLDDFGTGFSSMSHLREVPATELKIDRSFVTGMNSDRADHVLVRSTIDLAHNLGLLVVAEGVEDEATLLSLQRLGCDVAQGYHIAKPMPADDVADWLSRAGHTG